MATCLDLAGAKYPGAATATRSCPWRASACGPAFEGKPLGRPQPIFWEHEGNRAVRDGKWKLVAKHRRPWELYDLDADRTEQHDLAAAMPAKVKSWRRDGKPGPTGRGAAVARRTAETQGRQSRWHVIPSLGQARY